jgi:hypothetical protein
MDDDGTLVFSLPGWLRSTAEQKYHGCGRISRGIAENLEAGRGL